MKKKKRTFSLRSSPMEQSTAIRSSKSRSSSLSKSSLGGAGGEKKSKKESTCRALRTSRVRLVSDGKKKKKKQC